MILQTLCWLSLAGILYSYVGYPIIIWSAAKLFGRAAGGPGDLRDWPSVTLLIAAHNEEQVIGGRLENALELDYPSDKLEIVVASDASTDATASIVRQFSASHVRLLDYTERRGKAAVINRAMQHSSSEIVVFTDANTRMDRLALRRLVARICDSGVGVVCGQLSIIDPESGGNVDGLYWKYETMLKRCESRLGALLGANGGIYAMRRDVFTPIPDGTIVDDLVFPLLARLRTGCAIVYEETALASEDAPPKIRNEFQRRVRIGTGDFQSLKTLWPLLSPHHGWLAFSFASHKLARWCCPTFLLILLGCSIALSTQSPYRELLIGQGAFYAIAMIGNYVSGSGLFARLARLSTMFCAMNAALAVGFYRFLRGRDYGTWRRTERST